MSEKIISLLTFKIPYYVGPLNDAHNNNITSWVVRKKKGRVTPWNFNEMVDVNESRKLFINSKLNVCTYLKDEKVLPKNSLMYREFMVLNELNNLKVNGNLIDNDLKQDIFEDLFKKYKKVSNKKIVEYIKKKRDIKEDIIVSGIDGDFTQNLCSYIDIKNIIGDKIDEAKYSDVIESIIRDITLYGDDTKYINEKFEKEYKTVFSSTELDKLKSLKFSDWGRLSKKFLDEIKITNLYTGEVDTVIGFMRNYPYNLSELNSKKFNFSKIINDYNDNLNVDDLSLYSMLDKLYLSSPAKRMVWQTLNIVIEIKKIMKEPPKKIFIEMARGADGTKRTKSRKYFLEELYKKNKKEIIKFFNNDSNKYNSLLSDLQSESESNLRSKKLYLYYVQLGKCMYSLEDINKNDVNNINLYDKDHIYPKSKLFDDSMENLVLVKKEINSEVKKDKYPLDDTVINSAIKKDINKYWKLLHDCGFIGNKKYERLIRNTPFTKDELGGFIERQMVETRQASKEVANLLNKICNNSEIVYVKAENVSRFRNTFDIVKSRLVNDYHHVHDAYLNIVVGNIYNVKFTKDPRHFINNSKTFNYNLDKMFEYDVFRNNESAWIAKSGEDKGSIDTVYRNLNIKDIQLTKRVYDGKGKLFDVMIMPKTKGQAPQKENSKKSDINKYGGYNKIGTAYFTLVESVDKNGDKIKSIECINILDAQKIKDLNIDYTIEDALKKQGLVNPKVLYNHIKLNSLIKVNGFYYNLTGRSQNNLFLSPAVPLVLNDNLVKYIKLLEKFNLRKVLNPNIKIEVKDNITKEKNLKLYNEFMSKLESTIYKNRINNGIKILKENIEVFSDINVEDQCNLLLEILKIFSLKNNGCNLQSIGGATKSCICSKNNKLNAYIEFKLINQSITGIYKEEINLLKL